MPLNIEAQKEKLGISEGIANFAASFGVSIGQNGCAGIYPTNACNDGRSNCRN